MTTELASVRQTPHKKARLQVLLGVAIILLSVIPVLFVRVDEPRTVHDASSSSSSLLPFVRRPFCFVHVGKTAGGTLSCRLNPRLAKSCPNSTIGTHHASKEEQLFTRYVTGKLHKERGWGCSSANQPTSNTVKRYLVAVRDPVDRVASWFAYEHLDVGHVHEIVGNRPLLYRDCFDTLEGLASVGLKHAKEGGAGDTALNDNQTTCAMRAWQAITGRVGFQYHNAYHYQYYWEWMQYLQRNPLSKKDLMETTTTPQIMVIRHEYLSVDWNRLVQLYSGNNGQAVVGSSSSGPTSYFGRVQRHRHHHYPANETGDGTTTSSHPTTTALSANARLYLCWALSDELQIYRHLIRVAKNLTPFQKQTGLDASEEMCPPSTLQQEQEGSSSPQLHASLQHHPSDRMVDIPWGFPRPQQKVVQSRMKKNSDAVQSITNNKTFPLSTI